ncbi:MAG: glycine cleavage system aminomethyltransferase GcvT [Chloroflexi bacterium]|nr:glycine cleavage system aminomethyltransferase GcvT [Chloroflexota bacterium]
MKDFLFRGSLAELDAAVYELTRLEAERQARKLILIPSESQAPLAVREALASAFQNIYAEGYPDEETRWMSEDEILDYPQRLAHYRRYSDPRYYKGVEYADLIEALARRRCAEAFAANGYSADEIFVNVQALSGAPANNAVYHALLEPGDTVMGMNLLHGGHLTHGSSVNRSGKFYKAVHYTVDPQTERIDYEAVRALARQHRPKMIIAGYSSYPWIPDWKAFREIADEVGAYLMADIAHIGGLVAAGVVPSPLGYAHVITSTTHKTLMGPRGAIILTTDPALARKIDRAVFPGEQGGPHVNVFAALALTFKLARTEQFRRLQAQIVRNAIAMADELAKRGLRIPFGGTNSHLLNVDVTTIKGPDGTSLSGDQAARILDLVGIVVNRNTIPGDKNSLDPSGIRLGTPWITQRGFDEAQSRRLANIIADVLLACVPHSVDTPRQGRQRRAKIDFEALETARLQVREMAAQAGLDLEYVPHGYPHFYYLDDAVTSGVYDLQGKRVRQFLDYALSADLTALKEGQSAPTRIHTPKGAVDATVTCLGADHYRLSLPVEKAALVAAWLRDLSDGYVSLDLEGKADGSEKRLPGPVVVMENAAASALRAEGSLYGDKPWYIGIERDPLPAGEARPPFKWQNTEGELKRTPLYETHKALGAKLIPFAGWEMPVWYTSVLEEHLATRQAAGLFDVSHMGVYEIAGRDAASFLDAICANDCGNLEPGESLYTHFLTPEADVLDDTLVYRRAWDRYLVVVNAANDDKDRTWFEAVRDGRVRIDVARPWARVYGYEAEIRNLRDPKAGDERRVDIALQGPKSRDILLALGCDDETRKRILRLQRTQLCDAVLGGFNLIVSRTGYTGEKMGFELFVHPDQAVALWNALLEVGQAFGLKPVGLGARDSLRTEAGLPLYGHEMGEGSGKMGSRDLGVAEAGFGSYVKLYKPWFIGREAYIAREKERKGVVVRFRFDEQRVRMAHNGDPVSDAKGRIIGWVTSCAIDSQRYLTGQAYLELEYAAEGTPVFVHQGGAMDRPPSPAHVVSRFPKS